MRARLALLCAPALLAIVHAVALWLFASGFFLTRHEVPDRSNCHSLPFQSSRLSSADGGLSLSRDLRTVQTLFAADGQSDSHDTGGVKIEGTVIKSDVGCWGSQPRFKRAVILVIDALRYEYLRWYLPNQTDAQSAAGHKFHRNQLPVVAHVLQNEPEHGLLFQFRADPPTVTMQRLKGLTTGGMPTFIDVSENFDSSAISEDNLVHQLGNLQRRSVFMGDDTWEALFPGKFTRSYPYDSFNVKDLHTVDNGVLSHLIPEITSKEPWDVIVGHFLGVDHVGHRYDANHAEMEPKLLQMNSMLEDVMAAIDNDTVLFVMGDHGSTSDGNHGGASDDELNAGLFVYSKSIINRQPWPGAQLATRTVAQADFVPTFALLLGLPVPFGSLGSIIPELFYGSNLQLEQSTTSKFMWDDELPFAPVPVATHDEVAATARLCAAQFLNAWQVWRYVERYSEIAGAFSAERLDGMKEQFQSGMSKFSLAAERVRAGDRSPELRQLMLQATSSFRSFQLQTVEMCRGMWVTFDTDLMLAGLLLLGATLPVHLLLLWTLRQGDAAHGEKRVASAIIFAVWFGAAGAAGCSLLPIPSFSVRARIAFGFCAFFLLGFVSQLLHVVLSRKSSLECRPSSAWFCAFLVVLHGAGMLSNSFVEAEGAVGRFLCASIVVPLLVLPSLASKGQKRQQRAIWGFIVAGSIFASRYTTGGVYERPGDSFLSFILQSVLPLMILLYSVERTLKTAIHRGEQVTIPLMTSIRFALAVLVLIYWTSQQSGFEDQYLPSWARVILPRLVYLGFAWAVVLIIRSALARSAKFAEVIAVSVFPLALIQGLFGPAALLVMFFNLLGLAFLLDRPHTQGRRDLMPFGFSVSTALAVGMWYFGTGHSYDFNGLHWAAGFVGFEEMSFIGGAVLMTLETLCVHLLIGSLVPLFLFLAVQKSSQVSKIAVPMVASLIEIGQCFLLAFIWHTICATTAAFVHRRHLMVWRVFAPAFIFHSGFLLAMDLISLLAFWALACSVSDRKSTR